MSIEETKRLAEQGCAENQWELGNKYYFGINITQDYKQAFKWYQEAANQNHYLALLKISEMYETGKGVKKDMMKSFKYAGDAVRSKIKTGE